MNKKFMAGLVVVLLSVTTLIILDNDASDKVEGKNTREIVEELENATDSDVSGIVFQDYIEITKGNDKKKIYDEKDMFYVSIAPYINSTHS